MISRRGPSFLLILLWILGALPVLGQADRWESEIAAFERADRQSAAAGVDALFYGSSSFRLWTNVADAFPGVRILNRGFGGSQLSDLILFFDRVVVPHAPRVLLIYGGDNDIAGGKSADTVFNDFQQLAERVRNKLPRTRLAFVAVKPSPSREAFLSVQRDANARIEGYAKKHRRIDFIDAASPLLAANGRPDPALYLSDRLHLNAAGYELWRRVLAPYLKQWAH